MASVNEFGEIVRDAEPRRVDDDALWREYHKLEYEIFSHNDKSPEKLTRFHELERQLGISEQKKERIYQCKK